MPLTPDANLVCVSLVLNARSVECIVLDQLLGLDIVHAVHTRDTVTGGEC